MSAGQSPRKLACKLTADSNDRADSHLLPDVLPHGVIFIQPPFTQGVQDVHLHTATAVSGLAPAGCLNIYIGERTEMRTLDAGLML